MDLIFGAILAVMAIVHLIRGFRHADRKVNDEIGQQLMNLVSQAHAGEPFKTLWDIRVSDEQRVTLQAPLTPQQIEAMAAEEPGSFRKSVSCDVLYHMLKGKTLTGVVNVSIDIESDSGAYDYHVSNVNLRLTICHIGDHVDYKWVLSSVELL